MPHLPANIAKTYGIPQMNQNISEKSSHDYHAPRSSNEKMSSIGITKSSQSGKASDRNGRDKYSARDGNMNDGNFIPVMPLGNQHEPWPSGKVTGVDDVVKYMSSVPGYLQRMEKGESAREKALNFGVLDWGRLEKWRKRQKQVNKRKGDSAYGSNSSSAVSSSTLGSSSHCTKSTDSLPSLNKQSPALNSQRNLFTDSRTSLSLDKKDTMQIMRNPDPKATRSRPSEKEKIRYSDLKGSSVDKPRPSDVGTSSSAPKASSIPDFACNEVKSQAGRTRGEEKSHNREQSSSSSSLHFVDDSQVGGTRGEEKFHNCEQPSSSSSLHFDDDWLEDMWDHIQGREHAKHNSNDSAAVNNQMSIDVSKKSIPGIFPLSDLQPTHQPPNVRYSCPLSSINQRDGPSICRTLPASGQHKHVKLGQNIERSSEKSLCEKAGRSGQGEAKVAAASRRELSPQRLSNFGLRRSCTLREGSSGQQRRLSIDSSNFHENNGIFHSRSRRSTSPHRLSSAGHPMRSSSLREGSFRKEMKQSTCSDVLKGENTSSRSISKLSFLQRFLDPFVKLKNQMHFSGPATSLTSQPAQEVTSGGKLPTQDELKSAESSNANIQPLPNRISSAGRAAQAEKQVMSIRKALLKLIWKNERPLFVFSVNDNSVLAATIGKGSMSQKNDFDCMYTMFTAQEVEKKSAACLGQGKVSKKHDLFYNLVGQLKVSSSRATSICSEGDFVVREFVLYGSELSPKTDETVNSPFENELAAVIFRVPSEGMENDGRNDSRSLHFEQKTKSSGIASVTAILPTKVHGVSSTGDPLPLIERWRSGVPCDCGGWDEGCKLTVLTDKIQEGTKPVSSEALLTRATHRMELFAQGDDKDNKHAFRLIALEEGAYTVDFMASMALVQAFAVSLAILHSKKPHTFSGLYYSTKAKVNRKGDV